MLETPTVLQMIAVFQHLFNDKFRDNFISIMTNQKSNVNNNFRIIFIKN